MAALVGRSPEPYRHTQSVQWGTDRKAWLVFIYNI
jgi:hypothetical protein